MLKTETCVVIWIDGTENIGYVVAQYEEDGAPAYDIETEFDLIQCVRRDQFVLFADE
jgi:hypothetical protein